MKSNDTGAPGSRAILTVTNSLDYKKGAAPIPGSLRKAIADARDTNIIAFAQPFTIPLADTLTIDKPIAIDAAGRGLTLTRGQVEIVNTMGVSMRDVRMRCGDGYDTDAERRAAHGEYDNLNNLPESGGCRSLLILNAQNVNIVNCSIQNSTDDNVSVWGPHCRNIIFRNCLISGGYAVNYKVAGTTDVPAYKGFLGGADFGTPKPDQDHWITIDKCVFANCYLRTPDLCGGIFNLTNNVIVSVRHGGALGFAKGNVCGNWFITHPNKTYPDQPMSADPADMVDGAIYDEGNYLNGFASRLWFGQSNKGATPIPVAKMASAPHGNPRYSPMNRAMADTVVRLVGARPRDRHDAGVIASVPK